MTASGPGTVLAVGDPVPASSTHKAIAAVLYAAVPAVLAGVLEVLQNATTLLAGAPVWVLQVAAVLLILLTPLAAYTGAYRTPNLLKVPIQLLPTGTPLVAPPTT